MQVNNWRIIYSPERAKHTLAPDCFCDCEKKGSEIQKDRKKAQKLFKNRLTKSGIHGIMNELANRATQTALTTVSAEP